MKCKWEEVELSEVADLTVGFVGTMASHYTDSGVLFLRSTNIEPFNIKMNDVKYISPEFNETIKKSQLNPDDVVIVRTGKPGACTVIPQKTEPWNCSDLVIIHPQKEKINPHFLASYINLASGVINAHLVGAVQQHFNIVAAKKMKIPLPSIDIQNSIVSIIQSLNDKIELNNRINENLKQQAQAIYHEQFETINTDELPTGWRVVALGDIAIISKKNFNPSKEPETMLEHYSIPAFDESHFPVFELSTAIKSNKFVVDSDCFMISKLNPTTKRVWKPYCLTEKAVCSTEFIVYKAKDSTITDFLYSVIDSASFSDFMCSHVTGSTGSRQRTTPSDTLSFEFVLPSEDKLNSFQALVSPMYAQMRNNAIENDKLKRLRDSLLPKLMSGEVDVEKV